MAIYIVAAWMLAFCFALVIGPWHGTLMALTLPLLTLLGGAACIWLVPRLGLAGAFPVQGLGVGQPAPTAHTPDPEPLQPPGDSLSVVLEQFNLVLFKTDAQARLVYVSRGWEAWSGRAVSECQQQPLCASLHPSDREAVDRSLRAVGRGAAAQMASEVRLVSENGRIVPLMLRAQTWHQDDGTPAGAVGTLEELTRRKRLDEQLKTTRGYVKALLANVPGMVYRGRLDPSWTMEFVSDGCVELTGYEPYELVENQRVSFGSLIHPDDREFVWTQVQSCIAQRARYQLAYRITDASGRLKWVWEQARGVFSSHGELLAIEGFITDVGERRGAEEALRRKVWFEARTGLTSQPVFESLLAWTLQLTQLTGHACALLCVDAFGLSDCEEPHDREHEGQNLTIFARRFGPAIGQGAAACYLGKQQFAVLLTDFRSVGASRTGIETRETLPAVARLAARLSERLSAPLQPAQSQQPIGVAIGIAMSGTRYADAAAMLAAALGAARQAAQLGAGHCEFAGD